MGMVHGLLKRSMRVAGWPHLLAPLAVLLVLLGISGCRERAGEATASIFQIDAPEGHFTSVAWMLDDTIIAAFEPAALLNEAMFGLDLWRFSPSGAGFQRLDLPDPDFTYCLSVRFHRPSTLIRRPLLLPPGVRAGPRFRQRAACRLSGDRRRGPVVPRHPGYPEAHRVLRGARWLQSPDQPPVRDRLMT